MTQTVPAVMQRPTVMGRPRAGGRGAIHWGQHSGLRTYTWPQRARANEQPFQGATRCLLSLMLAAMPGGRGQRRLAHPSTGSPGAAHSSTDLGQNCIAEGTPTRFLEPQHKA